MVSIWESAVRYRKLGRTDIEVSELGFGCGSVGGLMIRGERGDMLRAVARAREAGITYFDTARGYGNGISETNLGSVLNELQLDDVVIGTKVSLGPGDLDSIEQTISTQIDEGLKRLGRDHVDVIYLHNAVLNEREPQRGRLGVDDVQRAAHSLQQTMDVGKTRCWGINGVGDTEALIAAVEQVHPYALQSCYNLLNPTAVEAAPAGFGFQDFDRLIARAAAAGVGVAAIRVLAAGALSGSTERHPLAMPDVGPIATGKNLAADAAQTREFEFLLEDGVVDNLVEAAIRFAISAASISTALVGLASYEQLQSAIAAVERGPLPDDVLEQIRAVKRS